MRSRQNPSPCGASSAAWATCGLIRWTRSPRRSRLLSAPPEARNGTTAVQSTPPPRVKGRTRQGLRATTAMHLAILSSGTGWHVADLVRAARARGHRAAAVDFRRLAAGVAAVPEPLAGFDAVIVRTM